VTPEQAAETDVLAAEREIQNDARGPIGDVIGGAGGPTMEDYEAAGFTEAEVVQFQAQEQARVLSQPGIEVPVQLTEEQMQFGEEVGAPMLRATPGSAGAPLDFEMPPSGALERLAVAIGKGLVEGTVVSPLQFVLDTFGVQEPQIVQDLDQALQLDEDASVLLEQLPKGIAQFFGPFAAVGKLLRLGRGFMATMGRSAAADFLGFEGNEGRLTDVLLEFGLPPNAITEMLRTDPNDPEYIGRIKNAAEGALLGIPIEAVARVVSALRSGSAKELEDSLSEMQQGAQLSFRQRINNLTSDFVGAARATGRMDLGMMREIFQRGGQPRSLGAAGTGVDDAALVENTQEYLNQIGVPTESAEAVQNQIASQKSNYPAQDGWAQDVMQVTKVEPKGNNFEVTYKEVPYNFEKPPQGVDAQQWASTMVTRVVDEIRQLATRASNGDAAAKAILEQANWYRSMRSSMRREFGGMGDVFADLLGTTSAQTGVEMNWNNAIEVMRRFSRGEYDEEIRMYQEMLDEGSVNPTRLQQLHKDPDSPFRLITNAAGSLFNANSPAATKALFDMFRVAGGSPKTPNFTGNLIGYTNAATIDVWAARFLRRLAGLDRLPPPVEKGVTGSHLSGSTLEKPRVGGEFGFGQRVLEEAARQVNQQQIIRSIAPNLADMNPDDLQAVAWFIEKEKWATNGWTTKAGEGGSFEFEASFAGAADPANVSALRRRLNQGFAAPNRRKKETDAEYEERVAQARSEYDEAQKQAQADLNDARAPLARYVLGISVERPGARPTNVQQAEVSARLGEPAKADPSVVMYQVNNTYGRFMQSDERAFNAEFVVRKNFDPAGVTRRMVEVAREADQDAAFISKVVPDRTPDSRPGVEIYFRNRQPPDFARSLSDKLTEYGVDGFTFVTDSRVMDRPSVQAGMAEEAVAGINGLRFQYIPEFDIGRDAWAAMSPTEKAQKIDEVEELFERIVNDLVEEDASISAVNLMNYETTVIERENYDEYLR
jgi:hypothetical protein